MSNNEKISISSDIQPFEYKPKLYYEYKCREGKVGNDELFLRIWKRTGSACNSAMPMMLLIYSNPVVFRKTKVKESAECLRRIIERTDECTKDDEQFLSDLVELSLDYSSITGSSTPVKATKALGKAWAGINRYTKLAAKQVAIPLNVWEKKQLMYAMYCAIGIYLINNRVFREQYSIAYEEGVSAYKKAISSGNKDIITYGIGKAACDAVKISTEGLFCD